MIPEDCIIGTSFDGKGENKKLDQIKKNEIIGLVGKTGSGKSTLVKIIMGLIDPTNGDVLIDGNQLKNIKYKWQKNISYIPQNFYILDDTILENVLLKTMYDLPSQENIVEVIIDSTTVKGQSQPIIVHSKTDNKSKTNKTTAA